MVPYEYRYLCEHKYLLALLNSIRITGAYVAEFTVYHITTKTTSSYKWKYANV